MHQFQQACACTLISYSNYFYCSNKFNLLLEASHPILPLLLINFSKVEENNLTSQNLLNMMRKAIAKYMFTKARYKNFLNVVFLKNKFPLCTILQLIYSSKKWSLSDKYTLGNCEHTTCNIRPADAILLLQTPFPVKMN